MSMQEPTGRLGCPQESTWSDFTVGRMPLARQSELAEHLQHCEGCRNTVARVGEADADDSLVRRLRRQRDDR
ncbi:MAG: hypothetical protein ACF8TS_01825, partial [Maioricimonas sp. JB049]